MVFIDDLGFAPGDATGPRHLRSWLDGGVEARPGNVRLAVTSNRRAIVARHARAEQDDPLNPRDAVDDQLALADRFGLSLGFHACSQDEYLAIVRGYAEDLGLAWDEGEALEWAKRRGARSGRVAWHFITELAGRAAARPRRLGFLDDAIESKPLVLRAAIGPSVSKDRALVCRHARIAAQLGLRRHPAAAIALRRLGRRGARGAHPPDDVGGVVADQQRAGPVPRDPGRAAVGPARRRRGSS